MRTFVCPICNRPSKSSVAGTVLWNGWDDTTGTQIGPPAEWALLQCAICADPLVQVREDYGGGFDADDPVFVFPAPRRLNRNIPEHLRNAWEEAQSCFKAKAYTATAVMVRRALEATCADQGVRERTLAQSLKKLEAQGKIDGMLAEWADLLRLVGNEGAHYSDRVVTREDAEDALSFSEALLDHLYVLRQRFEEFKARRVKSRTDSPTTLIV